MRSPLFFLLVAQTTQFLGCVVFSLVDLWTGRVPFRLMYKLGLGGVLGFVPFVLVHFWQVDLLGSPLPLEAPSLGEFVTQFVVLGMVGDLFHYLAHRWLHVNAFMRNHVHVVHHTYDGHLYSWIGMQVHPVEVCLITLAIYLPLFVFAHPLVLWTFALVATLNATWAHSGYEGFASVLVPFGLTSSDHQLHHELNSTKNYGNILRVWDWMFGTYGENTRFPALSLLDLVKRD